MNYILTQQEYDDLCREKQLRTDKQKAELQALCTLAARHIPAVAPSCPPDAKPMPWGCILDINGPEYCDKCPALNVCPKTGKEFSK